MTELTASYWPADTSAPVTETTVGGVLRAAAAAWPGRPAMVAGVPDRGARKRWTYGRLLAEAERPTSRRRGPPPRMRLAQLADERLDLRVQAPRPGRAMPAGT